MARDSITQRVEDILKSLKDSEMLPPNHRIKSISIDYKEMGEFPGELILPVIKVVSYDS